ncbi:MAG: tRNA (N6-isopentenyl adenosine(37)-C2)-methylthiotransferase MiaB [Fimbriimonadaceae bacterium]|nr:tRNA (N6-isopentenyl adenosine(37)-C2)-methylthiotransferase MiaB [Fimbriimonadaceae bacterium]
MTISPLTVAKSGRPKARRGTYFIQTWGCQMNEEDSEQIGLYLQQIGFEPAGDMMSAHVILLNTCSVRKKPEDKAFSMLGELALLKKQRPEIIVGVAGCMAQLRAKEIHQRAHFVDFVVGTGQLSTIPGLVEEAAQTRRFQTRLDLPERKGAVVTDIPQRLVAPRVDGEVPYAPTLSDQLSAIGDQGAGDQRSQIGDRNLGNQLSAIGDQNAGNQKSEIGNRNPGAPSLFERSENGEGVGGGVSEPSAISNQQSAIANQELNPLPLRGRVGEQSEPGRGDNDSESANKFAHSQNAHTKAQSKIQNPKSKIKAFVPIQYGCDKFCTFCIVPTTRGRERSRPTEDIVAEVYALSENGVKEVTLLGQTVNSYGKNLAEGRVPFAKLLWLLEGLPSLQRIRYTSPYPRDFTAELIECIRDNPKVMEHVHLPLQSGDNDMLKAMHRLYTAESFLEIVKDLRAAVPDVGITTDIIVGFPGETEEQFEKTLEMVREVRFDGAYIFIYSTRPGTPAAEMEQLPYALKQSRLKVLSDLQNSITIERNEACVGQTVEVLVEGPSPKNPSLLKGYSREFKMVHFPAPAEPETLIGQLVEVKLEESFLWGLKGQLI